MLSKIVYFDKLQEEVPVNLEILPLASLIPTQDMAINALLLAILIVGFFTIVVFSKKYKYLFDYIERFF
ncbi:MAG: hypothetical protein DRG78_15185 [Epsilonproteobacteria bacterium]|nr:MAG: hypothetical protein DRG78_15185 [Campylobacterota bacterium]